MKREAPVVKGPVFVKVKMGWPRAGDVGEWLGVSAAISGPLKDKVIVEFPDSSKRAYPEEALEWVK